LSGGARVKENVSTRGEKWNYEFGMFNREWSLAVKRVVVNGNAMISKLVLV